MRSSVIAYILVAFAVNALAAPAPTIYRRDGGAGSDSTTGSSGAVVGGTVTNSGAVVANGEDSGTRSRSLSRIGHLLTDIILQETPVRAARPALVPRKAEAAGPAPGDSSLARTAAPEGPRRRATRDLPAAAASTPTHGRRGTASTPAMPATAGRPALATRRAAMVETAAGGFSATAMPDQQALRSPATQDLQTEAP